ncbi:MAG: carboxylating nicotinate-nucleotide diphosphorylase [Pseudomonadota bacterium]
MTAFPLSAEALDRFVAQALSEDVGAGDITCQAVIPRTATLTANIVARENAIVCGLPLAQAFFEKLDPQCSFAAMSQDGTAVDAGQSIAQVKGVASALLTAERSALNILQLLSGIATTARTYVEAMDGAKAKLLDTRKTIPGYRLLSKYATSCGGAVNHRIGLFDAIMIKDNHIATCGSVSSAIKAAVEAGHDQIQVECDTLEQADVAVSAGATSLLLDNMTPTMLRQAVQRFGGKIPLEASGGVTLDSIRAIAETGVDFVSVGTALTLSAAAIDIGMDYDT